MILTGEENAKAIEEFEELMAEKLKKVDEVSEPIDDIEKLIFYSISRLYESCDFFRNYMLGCYHLFLEATHKDKIEQLLKTMSILASIMNAKGGDKDEMS